MGFNDQPLSNKLHVLLSPIQTPLVKLSLVNSNLKPEDLKYLAYSHHAPSLKLLRLDLNDLHSALDVVLELVPRLTSIVVLQMRNCCLTFEDAMAIAPLIGSSRTIRSWTIAYNYVHSLEEIKVLLKICSRSSSLREVGCRPAEYQNVCRRLFMHNRFFLSEEDKDELASFSRSLNLNVL
jgi:hypothetical protein